MYKNDLMTFISICFQIQQELDLILKKNVLPGSIQEWKVTWVPAIISYADSIKTKCVKKAVKEATEAYEGLLCMCIYNIINVFRRGGL